MEHNQGDYIDDFTPPRCHKFQFCVFYGVIWLAEKIVVPYRAIKKYGQINKRKKIE